MFGLSWIEFAACAVLALVVIGPRELPGVARSLGRLAGRMRAVYAELRGSLAQLEREVELTESPADPAISEERWQDFLPPEIRELRASIKPHTDPEETARKYREVRQAVAKARSDFDAHRAAKADGTPG